MENQYLNQYESFSNIIQPLLNENLLQKLLHFPKTGKGVGREGKKDSVTPGLFCYIHIAPHQFKQSLWGILSAQNAAYIQHIEKSPGVLYPQQASEQLQTFPTGNL